LAQVAQNPARGRRTESCFRFLALANSGSKFRRVRRARLAEHRKSWCFCASFLDYCFGLSISVGTAYLGHCSGKPINSADPQTCATRERVLHGQRLLPRPSNSSTTTTTPIALFPSWSRIWRIAPGADDFAEAMRSRLRDTKKQHSLPSGPFRASSASPWLGSSCSRAARCWMVMDRMSQRTCRCPVPRTGAGRCISQQLHADLQLAQ